MMAHPVTIPLSVIMLYVRSVSNYRKVTNCALTRLKSNVINSTDQNLGTQMSHTDTQWCNQVSA